jgi:putative NIF3 family GTP cyclohydrolase 1 type 2
MLRKDFIKLTATTGGLLAASHVTQGNPLFLSNEEDEISVAELQRFLVSLTTLKAKTVDRIIVGNPDARVRKIGTCWMPYWDTCRKAVESGVNVLVTHEPTFYTHWDLDETGADYFSSPDYAKKQYIEQVAKKKKWIEDHDLTIIRNHDTMDALKDYGIPFALGNFLDFKNSDIVASHTYYNVYKTPAEPAGSLARKIAAKLSEIGQPGVAFYGDPAYRVSSVGIGTGCICDPLEFADLNPDLFIAIDDVVRTWTQTTFAADTGHPLIVINHGTSEEMGMRSLNRIIRQKFPKLEVTHFNQGCSYQWITG